MYKQDFFVFSVGEYDEASDVLNDFGYIIIPLMCCKEVSCAVSSLNAGQKFKLLTDHDKPSVDFPFPRVFHCGCNRSFQCKWLEKYALLIYSKPVDGGFCRFCTLFARHISKPTVLVNKPFVTWVKVHKVAHNVVYVLKIVLCLLVSALDSVFKKYKGGKI